ncbi:MAG TPA: glycosyltransferase family 39 protein [Phototrophicaceae bacterium]|nr:glycosyltransferase family 39 protein [Phototrophicaceae bacterium]
MRISWSYKLLLICLAALILRLGLLYFVNYPGIADPTHYYNMAVRLIHGHGFTIDYIWQYSLPPQSIVHPEEHWMPLTAVIAGAPMLLFGESARIALLPFIVLGSLLPALSYWGARQLDLSEGAALFSAAAVAALPEFALYSLRTDTVIPCACLECLSILLLTRGLRQGSGINFVVSGIAAGLAYLTRNDGFLLLPMLIVTLMVYAWWRKETPAFHWRLALLMPLAALIVVIPWLIRDLNAYGMLGSPETSSMFFFTDNLDHYAFGRHYTLQTMLAAQTPAQIVGERLFELLAAVKVMIAALDVLLPVAVIGGLILMLRDRRRLLIIAPVLILTFGLLVAYPILIPYKAQAGSFKKGYMSILPLLIPLGAYALDRAISNPRIRYGAMALVIALAGANAVDAVRLDAQMSDSYLASIEKMAAVANALPDTNGDGKIILMTQDPYILRYVGIQSVMFPFEDRDLVIQIAQRYGVDYLLMPAARPALDPLLTGAVTDPRFVPVKSVPGTPYIFYAIKDGTSG